MKVEKRSKRLCALFAFDDGLTANGDMPAAMTAADILTERRHGNLSAHSFLGRTLFPHSFNLLFIGVFFNGETMKFFF